MAVSLTRDNYIVKRADANRSFRTQIYYLVKDFKLSLTLVRHTLSPLVEYFYFFLSLVFLRAIGCQMYARFREQA